MSTQVPERLGPYRLIRKIGEGGMGVVHLGIDADGGQVAVKVLHPHVAADLKARDRLTREVETMRRVRSPHVAQVLDAELVGGQPYVVTRFAPGQTLEDTVLADGPLEARQIIRLAQGLCQALVAIHAADVIHRDFKPSNVMLVGGEPLVIDFGIAHLVNATRLTQTGMFVGTPGYLAPEIIRDSEITQAADVHALASTVFFAATGAPPFGTGTFEAVCFNIMEGRAQLDKAPAWLRGWLSRALNVDVTARPNAQELLRMARALDPTKTAFHETPPNGTRVLQSGTRVLPSRSDDYADLLPPVDYGRRPAPPLPAEKPPPYVPAPMPRTDQRVAGYPPPATQPGSRAPQPYVPPPVPRVQPPPAERRRYVAGSQFIGLLLLVTMIALTVMMPVAVGAAAVAIALVLRVGEYLFGEMMNRRRMRGGGSSADPLLALVGTPWALVKAALVTIVHVPLSLMFGVCVWGLLRWGGGMGVNEAASYAAGAFTAGLFVLPGGGAPRKAVTRTLTSVLRNPGAALVATLIAGTIALLAVMFALGQDPVWSPWRAPETVIRELTKNAQDSAFDLVTGLVDDLMRKLGLGFLSPWS
ncbi:serine/threonine protein kinase [Nonomuraea sp. NBC_01738]|uniref:serine/threonine-protein kinase n=1 Tax=Nonomuraea sp. NBC_01738 TaxID=2976003 RepID=UPI002E0E1D98|nr:serine/threonine protein kinase [Nonomuraea sp. NBC_01738]